MDTKTGFRIYAVAAALAVASTAIGVALAQTSPAGAAPAQPTAAEKAIEYRQAVYKVVAGSFQPLAQVAQGKAEFRALPVRTQAEHLAAIADFIRDAYPDISKPDISNSARTRAKPEVWSNRTEFDALVVDFNEDARALAAIAVRSDSPGEEFKAAVAEVGNDCKGCHEKFRNK
jgi:cytochrome c556